MSFVSLSPKPRLRHITVALLPALPAALKPCQMMNTLLVVVTILPRTHGDLVGGRAIWNKVTRTEMVCAFTVHLVSLRCHLRQTGHYAPNSEYRSTSPQSIDGYPHQLASSPSLVQSCEMYY